MPSDFGEAKIYRNEEKPEEPVISEGSINVDEASRRINLGETGTFKTGIGTNTAGQATANKSSDIVFWAGDTQDNKDSAPFRVDAAGNVNMTSATISGVVAAIQGTFGGDGSDGALSITSGTTTLDIGSAESFIKNYTSISITGTGALAFTNPASSGTVVFLKSQGAVTITSSATRAIDLRNVGAAGGTGGAIGAAGTDGTTGAFILDDSTHFGGGGPSSTGTGTAGARLDASGRPFYTISSGRVYRRAIFIACGSGGGGGGGAQGASDVNGTGANGGRGGGALVIECRGALNFSGTIDASGQDGSSASNQTGTNEVIAGGGGGGGGAGMVVILYNSLTANTGTITTTGGAGGAGGNATTTGTLGNGHAGSSGAGGGGGGGYGGAGGAGGAGSGNDGAFTGVAGSAGAGTGAGGGGGSGGAKTNGAPAETKSGGAGGAAGATNSGVVIKNIIFG